MRGENKMITSEFVNKAISLVVERFSAGDYIRQTYYEVVCEDGESEEIRFFIDHEVEMLLNALGLHFCVELVTTYEGIGLDTFCLCVSYVLDNEIHTYNIAVEQHY
jgi:hypothetical protein